MDVGLFQWSIDAVLGVGFFALGFILKGLRDDIRTAVENQREFTLYVSETYARRDSVSEGMSEIRAVLNRIEEKIDRKADK